MTFSENKTFFLIQAHLRIIIPLRTIINGDANFVVRPNQFFLNRI